MSNENKFGIYCVVGLNPFYQSKLTLLSVEHKIKVIKDLGDVILVFNEKS